VLPPFSSQNDSAPQPRGLLYSGGRDGLVISWDLGLKLRKREERYAFADEEANKKNRVSSVWSLDLDEQGLEIGERTSGDRSNEIPWEMRWEVGEEDEKQVCQEIASRRCPKTVTF
jgi:hypothetical protein